MWCGKIFDYCIGYKFGEIDGHGVANHLFYFRFISKKLKSARKSLDITALNRSKWTHTIFGLDRVVGVNIVAFRHWAIHTTNGGAWLVNTENSSADITARVTIIEFNSQ